MLHKLFSLRLLSVLASMLVALATVTPARAGTFVETASEPVALRQDVSATIFFGSSTTDSGNFNLFVPLPSPPYVGGRTSNGPVWAEYFADSLGTEARPSFLGGTNYAFAGARTGVVNFGFIPPLTTQVENYLADVGGSADRRALYVVQAGSNDLSTAALAPPDVARQIIADTLAFTENIVSDLQAAGARRFVLLSVPELPTAPVSPVLPDGTNLAELMNDGFREIAEDLGGRGVRIGVYDLHGLVADVRADPAAFGLQVTECSFMGKSSLDIIISGDTTPEPCEPAVPVEDYMMFDDEHYTTTMSQIVADEAVACRRFLRGAGNAPPVSVERCAEGR
jgi:outer membrane lipase/esterase